MSSWESYVRKVVPYVPGEQPQEQRMIKLNTNENPYPPAPGVIRALKEFDTDRLRLYPEPTCKVLVDAIAEYYGLKSSQVFVGVGSDDVLAMIFMTFFNSKTPVWFPDITYSFYDVWADMLRIPYEVKPLDENFQIVKEDYYGENGGVVFPNPNAPTGILMPLSEIEDIIQHNRNVIVVVDEAYIDFGGESALPLIEKYDNLLVVQTFSKSRSMAGMRIGYAMGNEKLIKYINDVKYSFNSYTMNQTALALGAVSYTHLDVYKRQGQYDFMEDFLNRISHIDDGKGKGFFYWEPAWIPVPGSGWATPASLKYIQDPGPCGNEWANQALFDYEGNALPTLKLIRDFKA